MGIEVALEVFVKAEHAEKYKATAQEVLHNNPDIGESEDGVSFGYGYISLSRLDDLVCNLQADQVPCTLYVSNSSDPSIEDFTSEVKEVNGEWISTEITKSGQRVKNALLAILEKIESGESLEQLKAYLQEQIKMTC